MFPVGKLNILDYLINELDLDPLAKDKDGLTTIHAATQNERASTVKVTLCTPFQPGSVTLLAKY